MNRYENGKFYKITDVGYNKCYVGSTCESLSQRLARHRACYNLYLKDKMKQPTMRSFILFDEYGVEHCKIELIENCGCNSKEELLKREGFYIKEMECVNRCLSGRTRIEYAEMYRKEKPEKVKESRRQSYLKNPERIKQKSKEWNEQNKERKRQSGIEYREKNKEVLQQKAKERYEKNKEQIKERVRNYGQEKVECECGSVVRKADISKHTKTKKHQEYVSKTKTEV